jgi:S-DNA-T family DNA segregation ATPase FtsK/SpoIIIE
MVEVPFELIAPPDGNWWTSDSRAGIRVPLGRAGATKFQNLDLGKGTSQHVLVAGKTGSGKSTLLHALITNLALYYSPREVEFYLIDFKKGVEFKTYAALGLPHARVVAIESEREFGLSVLQRLDAELRNRGERFRAAGVQDLNAFRHDHPDEAVPRILLIVDEFQEFFTEDDKISQEVALLLDRLVRQGRAFGIHVLLGSQTLGGAYSLARSTLGQMAVRIALQCSESDAGLILSEDNTAARLLSRPGEAIYNDANGRMEGNDFFQVVWLPDEKREQYLQKVHDLAMRRGLLPDRPQIVFEGNTPAEIGKNHLLQRLLEQAATAAPRASNAWLGEAIAIKDPTAATFRPQSGSNLLILGQQEDPALGLMASSLLSLAAQHRSQPETRFYILDGTPVDDAQAGYLAKLAEMLPFPVKTGGYRDTAAIMAEVAAEVERRQQVNDFDAPLYLFVHGLQRFRDLRRADDDFGFGGGDKPATPAQQFATALREGPPLGVYVLTFCDSLTNANRSLDRQGLREFEMKVLFQMSATDSGMLIDSPAASKLGLHRALFHSEERGQPEKFRPYGLPTAEWLAWVGQRLRAGAAQNSATV